MSRPKLKEQKQSKPSERFGVQRAARKEALASPTAEVGAMDLAFVKEFEELKAMRFHSVEEVYNAIIERVATRYGAESDREGMSEFLRGLFEQDPEIERLARSLVK